MEYLQNLTDYLIANGIDSEKVETWTEDGELITTPSVKEDGFEIQYTCNFEMSDVALQPVFIFALISSWIQVYNSDRHGQGLSRATFATQRLSGKKFDIGIKIDFIEQFKFTPGTGNWTINGQLNELKSDFQQPFDVANANELIIFNGHRQDTGLENA